MFIVNLEGSEKLVFTFYLGAEPSIDAEIIDPIEAEPWSTIIYPSLAQAYGWLFKIICSSVQSANFCLRISTLLMNCSFLVFDAKENRAEPCP